MKKKIGVIAALLVIVALAVPLASAPAVSATVAVQIQVAMVLDGSTSINSTEWNIMVTGVATALNDSQCVPRDGSVEFSVIQFSTNARLEIGPVVITDANVAAVANNITHITQLTGSTCISCGLCLAADTLYNSPHFSPSIKQAINVVTDGDPNECSCSGNSCGSSGSSCNLASAQASAVCARTYLLTKLGMTSEQDEIDVEGIGITDANRDWLKNNIIFPATGYSNPPGSWPPPGPGWVRVFGTFQEFVPGLCEKFHLVIPQEYSLTVNSDGCCPITVGSLGSVAAGGSHTFTNITSGTNVTLTADDSDPCCVFDYWSGNASGTNPTIQVTMSGNKTVTGTCHSPTYNLTVESDGCCPITVEWDTSPEVEAGGTETFTNIPCGTNVTLTANNSTCCAFDSWEVTGGLPALGIGKGLAENIIVVTMDSNLTAVASCHPICGSVGDTLFYDSNNNTIQDPGEGGIQGVTVQLYKDDGNGVFNIEDTDQLIAETTTDQNGEYEFADVPPFCDQGYFVLVVESTLPAGVTLTTGSNPIGPICLAGEEVYNAADFGYLAPTPAVGGTAYPINKLLILLPWIALGAAITAGIVVLARRRRKAQS
jgi:hypothetical protein